MSAFNKGISSALKLGAFIYMISFVLANLKFNKNLFYSFLLFMPFLIYGIIISFSFRAGIDDGIRYLFPIVVLFFSYSIKNHFKVLMAFIIAFVVINFITQLFNYLYFFDGGLQWFYYSNTLI